MARELPRFRMLYHFSEAYFSFTAVQALLEAGELSTVEQEPNLRISDSTSKPRIEIWFQYQFLLDCSRHYQQCTHRGCEEKGRLRCKGCAVRYCSPNCQKRYVTQLSGVTD